MRRTEDARLLAGRGRFTDDVDLSGQAHMVVVRSPHPHARLRALEAAGALAMPGVLAVLAADDLAADGIGGIPALVRDPGFAFRNRGGGEMPDPPYPVLAAGKVRYAGEPVAIVVAETRAAALDAAEAVAVDYAPLAAVSEAAAALAPGAPLLRDEAPGNQAFDWETGDSEAVEAAIAGAAHVARIEVISRRRQRANLTCTVPSPASPPSGCRFHTRCPHVMEVCRAEKPARRRVGDQHWAACHLLACHV